VSTTDELLDPESWAKVLDQYARTMRIAVALIDTDGRLLGMCHNPQPIWSLTRAARPDWGTGCPFCLDRDAHCTAIADAQRTRSPVSARDHVGLAHVAVPLTLGVRYFGTLLAGQVFDRYPEPIPLERIAKEFGLSAQEVWEVAHRQIPVSRSTLQMYGTLLSTLGQAFLRQRRGSILKRWLAESNHELKASVQELETANASLKTKVAELDQSNVEKEILLREVHHRVNNNLQVIASLLRMQTEASPDPPLADALRVSQHRVESMALIHAQLYDSTDFRDVEFAGYATRLAGNLLRSYGVDDARIRLRVEIGPLKLGVDQAIPLGLILSELISNALKHAFPQGRSGSIVIEGGRVGERVELVVRDDGVGIAKSAEPRQRKSLGLQIVSILSRQLKATVQQPSGGEGVGASFHISFPDKAFSRGASIAASAASQP
jgi:two-component sensor histidine kinase/ligand-binding sensor protein